MSGAYWSYPPGWTNPVVLRASAPLPAAGAWDATPVASSATGASHLNLSFTYTRGAAAGAFDFQLQVSAYSAAATIPAGATEWVNATLYDPGSDAGGSDTQSRVQAEYLTFQPTSGAAEAFIYSLDLNGIERIRVRARESGVVGTPGTLSVVGEMAP